MKRRRIMKHGLLAAPIIIPTEILKESLRDIQTEEVVSLFDSIEKVLNSLHLKRRVSDWETVKSAAAIFFQGQVSLADINMIMEIYPEAYIIKWQPNSNDEKKTELCIKLPIQFFGKFETRSTKFREMLDDWCSLHSPDHPLVAMKNHIPTKPPITLNIHGISVSQCTVSAIAAIALEQRNIASLARQDSGSCISGSNGLKSLRDQIILRDLSKDVRAAELLRENIILETKNRLLSLTSLCDTLRTKCLTDNRTCLKIPELLLLLKSELFLTRKELTLRVEILEKIVPEFITVVAADNIVPVCTVRLNLHTSYSVVRQKVAEHVLSESRTM